VGLAALLAPASSVRAQDAVTVAPAGVAVEDLAAGIATTFYVDAPAAYDLEWHVHADPTAACAPTPAADDGRLVRGRAQEQIEPGGDTWTIYTTFPDAGRYLVCAWASPDGSGAPIVGQAVLTVREPWETIGVGAPSRVAAQRPFRLRLRAASQAWRMAFVAVNAPGVPCAASSRADRALVRPLLDGFMPSGAYTGSGTLRLSRPGVYRVCAWLQDDPEDPAPEQRVERLIRVVTGRSQRPLPPTSTSRRRRSA
jgi:hypothetical protein